MSIRWHGMALHHQQKTSQLFVCVNALTRASLQKLYTDATFESKSLLSYVNAFALHDLYCANRRMSEKPSSYLLQSH